MQAREVESYATFDMVIIKALQKAYPHLDLPEHLVH
jgi:hypothetical protein